MSSLHYHVLPYTSHFYFDTYLHFIGHIYLSLLQETLKREYFVHQFEKFKLSYFEFERFQIWVGLGQGDITNKRRLYGDSRQMASGGILNNYDCGEKIFFTNHSLI